MKRILFLLLIVFVGSPLARAVSVTVGTLDASGLASSDGTPLSTGDLILFGSFSLSPTMIASDSGNLATLEGAFTQIGSLTLGAGNPVGGAGPSDPANAGLFTGTLDSINTTSSGLNVAGSTLYYWVFNSSSISTATQQGIFGSSLWTIPSGNGNGGDNSSIITDIADLTSTSGLGAGEGMTLATTAFIPIGSFGLGTNPNLSGYNFDLAQISSVPEPAETIGWAAVAALGFVVVRRRISRKTVSPRV